MWYVFSQWERAFPPCTGYAYAATEFSKCARARMFVRASRFSVGATALKISDAVKIGKTDVVRECLRRK